MFLAREVEVGRQVDHRRHTSTMARADLRQSIEHRLVRSKIDLDHREGQRLCFESEADDPVIR